MGHLNKYGWTALHAACYYGRSEVVHYLINEVKVDLQVTNEKGWSPLVFTIMGSSLISHSGDKTD